MADVKVLEKTFQEFGDEEDTAKCDSSEIDLSCCRILLEKNLASDELVYEAAKSFKVPVQVLDDELHPSSDELENVTSFLVLDSFDNLEAFNNQNYKILGKTALLELAEKKEMLGHLHRPLYCHAMAGLIVCLSGFKKRDEISLIRRLIHNMGGSMRKDVSCRITHLIAKEGLGDKYYYALTFCVPIVMDSWVHRAWENRHIVGFQASNSNFINQHRLKPFEGTKVCFLGFPEEEKLHMIEILRENGGVSTNLADNTATHIVIDESVVSAVPPLQSQGTYAVKANWFWASVQNEGRENESNYIFEDAENTTCAQNSTPLSSNNRARKRKRIRSRFPSNNDLSVGQLAQKRRSSASDVTRLSDGSVPDHTASRDVADDIESPIKAKPKNADKRYHRFLELCQTESNYVNILNTIMTLFKATLDEKVDTDNQLLNATELKIIFGNLPPIYEIHKSMLEELKQLASQWNETTSIGTLFLKYSDELVKAYIPFINFFENTRDMLIKCDKTNPRFHAFLKICQISPECGRETLQDLLIRPVQRLPSITLLLNDILRHTPKNNPDYRVLESAIANMEQVMTKMNENKRRTEGQVALFDIFNDIDNCPVHLVSSQRCFLNRCEVTELSDNLNRRGSPLVLFMFSDVLEVSKKRMKAFSTLKSPKDNNSTKTTNCKSYKHIKLLSLSSIKRVIDIKETEDCSNVFALMINEDESNDEFYSFKITDDCVRKVQYLKFLCKQIATNTCRTDAENYLATLDAQELDITSSDVILGGTLGRAFNKFATKTKLKVERALSFNKTPNKLKRAMSTMMSPFANHNQLTPSPELTSLQLASFNGLPVKFWK